MIYTTVSDHSDHDLLMTSIAGSHRRSKQASR